MYPCSARGLIVLLLSMLVAFPSTGGAAPRSDLTRLRAEYLRLRNIDPSGDNPAHQNLWVSLASGMRGALVRRSYDSQEDAFVILAADTHLRLYRSTRQRSYLVSARSIIAQVTDGQARSPLSPDLHARALILLGDLNVYEGSTDSALDSYKRAIAVAGGTQGTTAAQRVQGIQNRTFSRFLPSRDREVPVLAAKRHARGTVTARPVVVLDPGHGGDDAGAVSGIGGEEKEIALDVARRVKVLLERRYGARVALTRNDDTFVPLARRTAFANQKGAEVFVSLHVNASASHDAQGLEVYYLDNTNDTASRTLAERENGVSSHGAEDDLSFMLSDLIQTGKLEDSILLSRSVDGAMRKHVLASHRSLRSLGVKKAPFFVLVGAHMPCSLVEMFFIDHPEEGPKLSQDSFRSALAIGIADGIGGFLRSRD